MGPVIIETERLHLRGWTEEDVRAFQALLSDPLVSRFINHGRPTTREQAAAFVVRSQRIQEERGWCRWALERKDAPGHLAGFCGVGCTFAPEIELGWTLHPDQWGQGLATEAATAALSYGFATVGFPRIISAVDPENTRSAAVAERLGMSVDGTLEFEGMTLLRYALDNPDPDAMPDDSLVPDCVGEPAGRSLSVETQE